MYKSICHHIGRGLLCLFLAAVALALNPIPHLTAVALESERTSDDTDITPPMKAMLSEPQLPQNLISLPLTPCIGGMAGPYPCNNIDLVGLLSHSSMGGGTGNDIWGWTDSIDGTEYAIVGSSSGTSFVDLSDPENPLYLGNLPSHNGVSSTWRDMKVYADHVFIVADGNNGHGMQVFDLTQLRNVVNPPVTFSNTAHYSQIEDAHNIVINEQTGYAYAVGGTNNCGSGLHMIDVTMPISPTFAGCFSADGYTHDAQCVIYNGPDVTHQGQEVCFNSNEDTLTIVDVTNKAAPVQLSRTGYAGSGYTHQGWLTEDHAYFLLGDELDESNFGHNTRTYIWDVSDLDNPSLINNYTGPNASIDHNLYIKGNYVFESNYSSGLHILDISDIANGNLVEEAFFDTYPADNNVNFSGQWSNYPFFDSGLVIANDRQNGLFILRPTSLTADFSVNATPNMLAVCRPNDAVYTVDVAAFSGFAAPVTLSASGHPNPPDSAVFSNNNTPPPFTSTLTIGTNAAMTGTYNIAVVGMSPTTTHTTTVGLMLNTIPPGVTSLISPADGAGGISLTPTYEWTAVSDASSYHLEVATDAGFSTIVYTATIAAPNTSHTGTTPLASDTLYYWRVTTANGCGSGTASTPFTFSTGTIFCSSPNLAIPDDDPTGVSDDLVIASGGNLTDLNISLDVTHTWVGDLAFSLEHVATGTTVTFYDRPGVPVSTFGCAEDDVAATINDEGVDGDLETTCNISPAIGGDLVGGDPPNTSLLATFDGENLSGTWRITASDHAGGDTGTLNEWCLLPTTTPAAPIIEVAPAALSSSQFPNTQVIETMTVSNTGSADLLWDIFEDGNSFNGGGWSDDFDSYATGSQMHGQGDWKGWDNNVAFGALTSDTFALSAPNSVDILGASDLVHEFSSYTSGQWVFTAWQYIPSSMTGLTYFILLNSYNDGGPYNWSTTVSFDSNTGLMTDFTGGATLPFTTDAWKEIRVEIDLDADAQSFYYDDQLLYAAAWSGYNGGTGPAAVAIAAVDLFANGATSVYYDNISLTALDTVCDAPDDIPWVTVTPISGTVPAASADLVDVTFDSTGLATGVYTGTLCVNSNDIGTPLVEVPVEMTIPVNQIPVAQDDAYDTPQDTALTVSAPGVLGNDSDGDGQILTAVLDSASNNGTLALNPDGSFTYTPTLGFDGSDSFTYHASDGIDASNIATVTISVVNTPPVAMADSYTVDQDSVLSEPAPGVLGNDSDDDGDGLTAVLDSDVSNGSLTLNADGSFIFTPTPGFVGSDNFTYYANDGSDNSNIAIVTITVQAVGSQIYLPIILNDSSSQANLSPHADQAEQPNGLLLFASLAILPIAIGLWLPSRKFGRFEG